MGRTTNKRDALGPSLFESLPEQGPPNEFDIGISGPPIWSTQKSELVAEYIRNYQRITRGGFYIDGFAAPQKREHEDELWTARKVLEIEPKRIRRFWLVDMDRKERGRLLQLKSKHEQPGRHVHVITGDFNQVVDRILGSGRIRGKSACFAFLDQRGTECDWDSLRKLAEYRRRRKIELLYLFPSGWTHRTIGTVEREEGIERLNRWWGRPTWREDLTPLTREQQVELVQERFEKELGYPFVLPVPIRKAGQTGQKLYYLIHASAHDQANILMKRAYKKIVGRTLEDPTAGQVDMGDLWS